jgi:DNA-binding MarR family transcriptional regulator
MPPEQRDSVDSIVEKAVVSYPFIDPDVEAAVDRIAKLHRYLEHLWERTAQGFDLNRGGYKVLLCLVQAQDRTATPGVLSRRCMISTGAMTNRIDRLEARGFVERVRDDKDRRSVKVRITGKGVEVLEAALVVQAQAEIEALSVLDAEDKAQLNELLGKLMRRFEAEGDLPAELLEH